MQGKIGVTKRTRDRNVTKFAAAYLSAWKDLNAFVESNCAKKSQIGRETFRDKLCDVVDRYINLNYEIITWCHKNGVDPQDFVCDVMNKSSGEEYCNAY